MEKVIDWLCAKAGVVQHSTLLTYAMKMEGELANYRDALGRLSDRIDELSGRIDDLEAAYPDYNKAKEQAEENKGKEIVPGFRPFTQRKKAWEAQHRKPAEKK